MANYLLLRNNKESGPYSLDGLMELGLKPYDLIWIQGKSAAWRYPSEVDELKAVAPAVEEQPFDRFFKKSEDKKEILVLVEVPQPKPVQEVRYHQPAQEIQQPQFIHEVQQPQVKQEVPQPKPVQKPEIPAFKPEHEKYIPKKSVFVAMPGQKTGVPKEQVKEPLREPVRQTINESQAEIPVQQTITISENPVAAQVKYSQPLDEIKEMYVKTLQDRKQRIARKSFWMQSLKKAAALLSLVAVGLIAGFVIKSNGSKEKNVAQQQPASPTQPLKSEVTTEVPAVKTPDTVIASTGDAQSLRQPSGGYVNKSPVLQNNPPEPQGAIENATASRVPANSNVKKETVTSIDENKPVTSFVPESVEIDQATGERNRKVRSKSSETFLESNLLANEKSKEKANERKPSFSSSLSRFVSVKSNEYKRVAFGGIRDLQLTITNDSKYVIDNVIVELQYIKPNELPLKTENIEFTSIGPNATSTIRVPDTNRGIRVDFRIIQIKSRQSDEAVANN